MSITSFLQPLKLLIFPRQKNTHFLSFSLTFIFSPDVIQPFWCYIFMIFVMGFVLQVLILKIVNLYLRDKESRINENKDSLFLIKKFNTIKKSQQIFTFWGFMNMEFIQNNLIVLFYTPFLIIILILLDTYLKEKEYSYVIDVQIPRILLYLPLIILIPLLLYFSVITSIIISIIIQILFVVPLLAYLNNVRNWENDYRFSETLTIFTWNTSYLYYDKSIALIYIYTFIVLLGILRFLSIGITRNLEFLFSLKIIPFIILFVCYLPLLIPIILKILSIRKNIQNFLWNRVARLTYSYHLKWLQKTAYFTICKKIVKYMFLFQCYCSCRDRKFMPRNRLEKTIKFLYTNFTKITYIFLAFVFFSEFFLTFSLYYWFHIIFWFLILRGIYAVCWAIYNDEHGWEYTCCLSDYAYGNYLVPHYPQTMWGLYFKENNSPEQWFGFTLPHSLEQYSYFETQREKYEDKIPMNKPPKNYINYDAYYTKMHNRINSSAFFPRRLSLTTEYKKSYYGVRWITTTTTTQIAKTIVTSTPIHNGIALTLNTKPWPWQTGLLNISWQHISKLSQIKNSYPNYNEIYKTSYPRYLPQPKNFVNFIEQNMLSNFPKFHDKVNIYDENLHKNLPKMQKEPDLIIYPQTYDLKTGTQKKSGRNTILKEDQENYIHSLNKYHRSFKQNHAINIDSYVERLKIITFLNYDDYFEQWLIIKDEMAMFVDQTWLPPLRINEYFCTTDLKSEFAQEYAKGLHYILKTDKILKKEKIKSVGPGEKEKEDFLDIFYGSKIQELLTEEFPID